MIRMSINRLARREGVHSATAWRWTLVGVHGVKLRSVRVGGRRYILEDDWQAFCDELNADLTTSPMTAPPSSTKKAERAGHELDALLGSRKSVANT